MKSNTRVVLSALAVLVLAAVAISILTHRQHPHPVSPNVPFEANLAPVSPAVSPTLVPVQTSAPVQTLDFRPETLDSTSAKTQAVAKVKKPGSGRKKVIQDPLAREALALVGTDPIAEDYWFAALGNSSLAQSERQDLVDDLNEEGLADPKNPTIDELPLLLIRLELLEEAAFWFGDQYEWQEPYRDLTNLVARALGSGEPVN